MPKKSELLFGLGVLSVFAQGYLGHDVGRSRDREVSQLGGGIAWRLDLHRLLSSADPAR